MFRNLKLQFAIKLYVNSALSATPPACVS